MSNNGYDGDGIVRPLEKLLLQLGSRKGYDRHKVFEGFVDYLLWIFDPMHQKPDYWPYTSDDSALFYEAAMTYFNIMDEQLHKVQWYDAFGDLYMAMHNHGNGKGQFFTPSSVCDMLARIEIESNKDDDYESHLTPTEMGERIVINDPASGSGRLPLAAYAATLRKMQTDWGMDAFRAQARRPYLSCEDLDYMCTKMAAINICMHGAYGEAVCHNSLTEPEAVHLGYIINDLDYPFPTGIPSIRRVADPTRFVCTRLWMARRYQKERGMEQIPKQERKQPQQLSLF